MRGMSKLETLARMRPGGARRLAVDLGKSESYVSRILKHQAGVTVPTAKKLLEIFPSLSLDDMPSPNAPKAKKRQKSVRAGRVR
jgi:AraC-like DNA-binding protein